MIPADPSHAPWCRAILIPCRICQLGFELITIGLLALAVGVLVHDDNDNSYDSHSTEDKGGVERAGKMLVYMLPGPIIYRYQPDVCRIRPVWLSLISTCLILTTTEITLLARKRLKPLPFLITNILDVHNPGRLAQAQAQTPTQVVRTLGTEFQQQREGLYNTQAYRQLQPEPQRELAQQDVEAAARSGMSRRAAIAD
ncbi:unnamed protein product [Diplocarpon coronariae]|uniref:Uncharacterized protein n=1 Tax=Diplocarpon coronariae TaxID=2795749 RepID=A0A218ZFF1_9HELO|nr:hypothetical protein B2J93_4 [Marssonina coronariae]